MSQIAIKGATTGTGVFTLESPATNTDRTLVLPDEAGTVLTSASSLTGLTGVGKVLQLESNSWSTYLSTSSTSFAATGKSVTITPTATSSKILLFISLGIFWDSNNVQGYGRFTLYRNGSNIGTTDGLIIEGSMQTDSNYSRMVNASFVDSPSSTSALTYELYAKTSGGTLNYSDERIKNSIIAMEIAA